MCGLGSMSRSGLGCTRRGWVVGRVGVDACSVGRHALGWPGGHVLCGHDTKVAQLGSACGMCFGRIPWVSIGSQ